VLVFVAAAFAAAQGWTGVIPRAEPGATIVKRAFARSVGRNAFRLPFDR
jgi:hypothetical protein